MAIVKTIKKGESLSIGFAFPETYDITRLQNVKVYIGSRLYANTMDGQIVRVVLRSNDTKLLTGTNIINLLVDDSIFGIRKVDYGALQVLPTQAIFSDESINLGYDFLIPLIVTENTISTENVLYSVIEGITPHIGENGNWFIGSTDTGVQAKGDATQQWVTDNFVKNETDKSLVEDTEVEKLSEYPKLTGIATDGFVNAAGELEQIAAAVGGFANNLYFSPTNSNVVGYKTLTYDLPPTETIISQAVLSSDGDLLVASHLFSDAVAADIFPAGLWSFEFYGRVSSVAGVGATQIGVRYFRYTSLGAKVYLFPAIVWSNAITNTVNNWIPVVVQQPSFVVEAGDRMGCDIYVKTSSVTSKTVYYILGDGYASYLNNPNAVRHRILRAKNEELAYQHLDATTEKTTPIDADSVGLWNSVTGKFIRTTLAKFKTFLSQTFAVLLGGNTFIGKQSIKTESASEQSELGNELLSNIGWTSTGWTGDFDLGFTNTSGNNNPLIFPLTNTGQKYYLLSFKIDSASAPINGDDIVTASIGNSSNYDIYKGGETTIQYYVGIQSVSNGNLVITPGINFEDKIYDISLKEVTGDYECALLFEDNTNSDGIEIRNGISSEENVFIGKNTGKKNNKGFGNVFLGALSFIQNISGFANSGIGYSTQKNNIGGSRNSTLGYNALRDNLYGRRNVAIGSFSLVRNQLGNENVSIGSDALFYLTNGSKNIVIGPYAMYNNEIGSSNIAIGISALVVSKASENIAIGELALSSNVTGTKNVSIGISTLRKSTGNNNTSIGSNNSELLETGTDNIAIGYGAGQTNVSGSRNIMIGNVTGTPANNTNDHLNIGNSFFGKMIAGYRALGVGNSLIGAAGETLYAGNRLEVYNGGLDIVQATNTNGAVIGRIAFYNNNNINEAGGSRKYVAYIQTECATDDANINGNSGGLMKFFIKQKLYANVEAMRINPTGNICIGGAGDNAKLEVLGGVKIGNDASAAGANNVGTIRYRTDANNSYVEMCMQTGTATYAWVVIKQNTW